MTAKNLAELSRSNPEDPWFWRWYIFITDDKQPTREVIFCYRPGGWTVILGDDLPLFLGREARPVHPEMLEFWEFDPSQQFQGTLKLPIAIGKVGPDPAPGVRHPLDVNPGELVNLTALKPKTPEEQAWEQTMKSWERQMTPQQKDTVYAQFYRTIRDKRTMNVVNIRKDIDIKEPIDMNWDPKHKRWEVYYDQYKVIREGRNKWRVEKVQK